MSAVFGQNYFFALPKKAFEFALLRGMKCMKKSNVFLSAFLVLFIGFAWISTFKNSADVKNSFRTKMESADRYAQDGLYQKSLEAYEQALIIEDTLETRCAYLETYQKACDDGVVTANAYINALNETCTAYPEYIDGWQEQLTLLLDSGSYTKAYDVCKQMDRCGVSSEQLVPLINRVKYSVNGSSRRYNSFIRSANGYYSVSNSFGLWGVLDDAGETVIEHQYRYIGPHGANGMALYATDTDSRIVQTSKNLVEAILPNSVVQAGAFSDGLIPIKTDEVWSYYQVSSQAFSSGTYDFACNFTDGVAAVCDEGKWMLIDTSENPITDTVFDDIKVQSSGDFCYNNVVVAAVNGEYGFYDTAGKKLCDFSCSDADLYYGEPVAFCDDTGKWGFVDISGSVVLEPRFAEAKSFSGGLAAVSDGTVWGYINADGDVVIDYQFAYADYFTKNGVTLVSQLGNDFCKIYLRFPLK